MSTARLTGSTHKDVIHDHSRPTAASASPQEVDHVDTSDLPVVYDGMSLPGSTPPTPTPTSPPIPTSTPTPPIISGCAPGQININTVTYEELQSITQIGPVRAAEMLDLRPFRSVDDMLRINGIGPARLQAIKSEGLACVH